MARTMAEMRLLETLWFSFLVALLTEVQQAQGQCNFTSITSPSASNLNISWPSFPGATTYSVELRVVNSTTVAPVVLQLSTATTEKLVQGLHPGSLYQVTLKVYQFSYLMCISSSLAYTVPAASQITFAKAISSTAIRFQWSSAQGALSYVLMVDGVQHSERRSLTSTTLSGDMTGLQPNKPYNCYVYSSNEAGRGAKSSVKTVNTLVQPPSVVTVTTVNYNTAHVTWSSVSGVLLYQVSLMETNQSGVAPLIRNISGLSLNLSNLKPCLSYTIGVSSISMFLQPGEPTTVLYTTNPVPPVSSISVDYSCSNSIASISWEAVFGATSYRAVATSSNGTSLSCTSSGTSCQISALECGERYTVLITSIAACESTSNSSYTFETAPCPPKNPEYFVECYSNVIIFYWEATNNTAYYIAESVDSDGVVNNCVTTNTSCFFPQIECGRNYSFTVSSVYSGAEGCNTRFTLPVTVSAAPCLPQNVRTSALDCLSDTLVAKWDPAPGALSYTVRARGNRDDFYNCTSSGTTCNMTDVKCGQSLSVWISASNNHCITDDTLVDVAETVPCTPQDISLVETCDSFSITLSWLNSNNAVFYTAKAILPNSTIRTCNTMYTQCEITGLECGQTYEAFVMATNFICNSTESQHIIVKSAPCAPVNVQAEMDCQSNTALVQWQGQQASSSYTAVLADNKGGMVNCSTSSNTCSVPNLLCGHTYNITVMQNDTRCLSLPSTSVQIESVPCVPQQVVGVVNCSSGAMTVGWNSSVVGVNYTTAVWSGTGDPVYCNSSEPHCSVGQLDCGKAYQVTVLAARGTCQSAPSQQITVEQVPCIPTNVAVSRECGAASVGITWAPSPGAHTYIAIATDTHGQRSECTSNGTSCSITHLACGQVYSVGVMAANDNCSSQLSQTVAVHTDPCAPTNISGLVNCSTSTASLLWSSSPNALHYIGKLESHGDVRTCNVSTTGCQISGLLCGQRYNFSVSASDGSCPSAQTAPIQLDTAPCAPQNVSTTVACNTSSVTVSWSPAAVSQNYVAIAVWNGGSALSCSSQSTSCTMQGLQCGQQYNITVSASNGNCSGPASPVQTIQTAPCIPQNVNGHVTCGSGSLVASWDAAPGASSYIAMISASGGPQVCVTANLSCVFTGLQCARQYNLSVASRNGICNSTNSPVTTLSTAPCLPTILNTSLDCATNAALLSWTPVSNAVRYVVNATSSNGHKSSCISSNFNCSLTGLACGQTYSVYATAQGQQCDSSPSTSVNVITAPCPPSMVNTYYDCRNNTALIGWSGSDGSITFVALLQGDGYSDSCSTTGTNCSLTSLRCGRAYNVTVKAVSSHCNSSYSQAPGIQTVPCATQNVSASWQCANHSAVVAWSPVAGVSLYGVTALGVDGDVKQCNSTNSTCQLSQMHCGQAYDITVTPYINNCTGVRSAAFSFNTGPCAPTNLSVDLQCQGNVAAASWLPAAGADSYVATATASDGHTHNCTSTSTSCSFTDLHCGESYSISVVTLKNGCPSDSSGAVSVRTAPCLPTILNTSLDCATNAALLSWTPVSYAVRYVVNATSSNGHKSSCISSNFNCSLTGLACGQTYSVYATAQGQQCDSSPSTSVNVITAPCPPSMVNTYYDCRNNTALIGWSGSDGSITFVALLQGDGYSDSCSTTGTNCSLTSLRCGRAYNVTVKAVSSHCNSSYSQAPGIQTVPCATQNVSASWQCANHSAVVAWSPVAGVSLYGVTALGVDGDVKQCNSTTSTCQLSQMHCGQAYDITVTPYINNCTGVRSAAFSFNTGPCAPTNLSVDLQCQGNVAAASWLPAAGADSYVATATASDGHTHNCTSTSTSCSFTDLHCGESYSISVVTLKNGCPSDSTGAVSVTTAPCLPTILNTSLDCATNAALLSWTPVSNAVRYVVNATSSNGHKSSCISSNFNCSLTGLACGQTYSVYATAQGQQCDSSPSTSVNVITAPCPPSMVNTYYDCRNNTALIGWSGSDGSITFVALLQGDGYSDSCSTTGTNCSLTSLRCGRAYNVTVKAVSSHCNSSYSQAPGIQTVPCATQNVSASWQCANHSAVVAWSPVAGVSLYGVTALGVDGDVKQCNSTTSTCQLSQMHCGQAYDITVTPYINNCTGVRSAAFSFNTGPCAPTNLSVDLQCQGNVAAASWLPAAGADSYVATATASDGHTHNCTSTSTSCSFTDLHCGETYSISVVTLKNGCPSDSSGAVSVRTVPCVPPNVSATVDCRTNAGNISWGSVAGAVAYNAKLVAGNGLATYCSTGGTSCVVTLECGQNYSAVVVASTDVCNSSQSTSLQFRSAPCPPTHVLASLNCSSNSASVSWDATPGATLYMVSAVGSAGYNTSCNNTSPQCSITNLQCGQDYSIRVTAQHNDCFSPASQDIILSAGTRAKALVQTVQFELLTCQSGNLSVVWQPTSSVQMFRAEAVTFPGHLLSCYSASTSCVIPNLGCGQAYDVSVVAVGDSCNSSRSIIRQASTAPCPPSSVAAVVNCSTNTATVSWNPPSILDVVYIARAVNNMASPPGVECNSTNSSCTLTGLQCSTQYNVTVTATKNNCTSAPSAVYSFFTAPCVPTLSDVVLNCDSGSALALWSGVVLGSAELYTVTAVDGQGEQLGCNNTQTQSCTVQGLQCGRTYTFSLTAAHSQCTSMASNTLQTHSAACPAQAIRTTIGCRNSTASVSWSPGEGAVSYSATLQSSDGHTYTCNSTTTSCDVTNLPCGQTYSVTVAAKGLNCSSTNSTGSPVTTAPCVPQNVSASVNCSSNIGTVSWQSSQGATLYFVIANSSNGQSTNCSSATTSCDLSSLVCGLTYTVTVMAKDSNCTSACSAPVQLQTAPCVPTLSDVVLNCSSGSALAVWSVAGSGSGGADLYSASAVDGQGGELRCNNTQTASCIVFGLQCGRTYTFSVTAARGQCTSMASNTLQTHTAACPARAIQTTISCRNNTASVSWSPGAGAVSYSATLQSSDGHTYPCNSTTTSCDITNLPCGQTYSVTVAARGLNCSSTNSTGSPVTTAPCVPQNVSSSVNCSSNIAVVSWQNSQGAALYFAVANSSNGQSVNCTSASTSCNLAPLACGLTYTVTVMAKDSNCTSACSAPVQLQTVPCVPQNVVAGVDCETNNVTVSWSPSMGARLYTATLRDGDGLSGTCQSNEVQCNATGLRCGQMYHVSVTASNDQCTSTPSTSTDVHSVPCAPSSISAVLNCTTDVAEVMWWPSAGSQGYRVSATASLGQIARCSSTNSSTSCSLGSLTCGAEYTVSVQALGATCNSSADMNGHLVTEPCVPHLLPVQYQNSIAQFSWDFTQGADSFVALAVTQQNLNITCPETADTNCALSGMQCGQIYNVSVSAHNSACNGTGSATSSSHQLMTEPCPPQNVQARMNCSSLIAYISWDASLVAVGYVVFLNGWNGDSWISATSQTSYSYPGLSCGTHYTTYVKALGQVYNSSESDSVNLLTAPCVPDSTSVSVQVDCATDTALLSWAFGSAGVDNYTAVVLGSGGHISSCSTEQNQCNVSLLCGQSYNLTLISVNQQCQIPTVMNTTFHSRPCEPVGVAVNVLCNTSSAEMSWQRAQGVDYYIGRAVRAGDGHESVCNSTSSSCMFSTLACGQNYTFTVTAYTGHCSSNTSQPVYISAGPCRPDNLTAQVFCANQTVALDWSDAPGAWQYVVTVSGDLGLLLNFSSASSALSISLACGQSYSVIVLGQDQHCISQRSAPVFFRSAPCAPSGLIAARNGQASGCGSAGAVLSWNASAGADMYVVKGWSLDGHTFSLSTSLSTISLSDLVCSQTYNLTVTASNQQCNSTPSLPASLQTVSAVLDCVSSVAVVSWQPNNGTAIYTVTLLDSSEPPRSCVGVGSQCNISGLSCGKNYSVSVTVSNDQCNSTTTLPTSLQTAPCPPVNIFLTPGCANNSAVVVWDHSQGAISYNAYAVSSNGNISCQSTLPTCILTNLTCGSNYSVHVVAMGNNCSSAPSHPVVHSSVPCQPTNVSVAVQCANATAVLSWAAQTGAVQYFATAQSDNGTSLYCQTTSTFCTLQGLQCGAVYNFTVLASNGACNSSYSQTLTGGGVPCPPGSFRVVPSVLLGQGQLLRAYWSIVNCPNSRYLLEVSGSIQGDSQSLFQISSYWTSRTYFETPVPCSSTYSASVKAQNSGGTSAPTAVVTGTSVPCPPLAVTFTGSNSSAVVAWNASLYATVYHVYQVTSNGRIALCNTSQLSCPVTNVSSNLIMVTAGNAAGESAGTSTVTVRATRRRRDLRQTETGELASPKAHFTMVTSDSLWLEWTHVKDAKSYSLLIREQSSSSKPIITTVYGEASIISELKPATTYCVSLSARNSDSNGAYSEPVCVQTAALS
ncbi:hypothetical protein NFI96_001413 [Prochilodus magdalenae]|nr:hypothetical protein NFI96_001413 [Prochilodus magdalenae]